PVGSAVDGNGHDSPCETHRAGVDGRDEGAVRRTDAGGADYNEAPCVVSTTARQRGGMAGSRGRGAAKNPGRSPVGRARPCLWDPQGLPLPDLQQLLQPFFDVLADGIADEIVRMAEP